MVGEGGSSAAAAPAAPKPVGKIYSCVCGQAQEVKLYKFASKCRLCNTRPKYLIDDYSPSAAVAAAVSDVSSQSLAPLTGGSSSGSTASSVAPSLSSSPSPCPRHRTSSSSSRRKQRQNSTDGSIVDAASTASESSATSPHRSVRSTVSSATEAYSASSQPKVVRRSKTVDCGAPESDRGLAEMFAPNVPIRRSRSASQRSSTHTESKDRRGCSCRVRKPRRSDTEDHSWTGIKDQQQLSTHEETTQEQGLYYGTEEEAETTFPMETQVLTHMVLTDGAACQVM